MKTYGCLVFKKASASKRLAGALFVYDLFLNMEEYSLSASFLVLICV